MNRVKIGLIGIGNIGSSHLRNLMEGQVEGADLVAICDSDANKLSWASDLYGDRARYFEDAEAMFEVGIIDAVIIAVPHYDHPVLAKRAFEKDLHVLIEKPAGVYTKKVREMNDIAAKSGKIFGIMYNQRTNPLYKKLKELIEAGELGEIKRTNWIITDWYRQQSYYNSGGWRATWSGEGGGVLLNQDPHQLDLWQWTCGMPKRIRAFCGFGKNHNIEVEDDVTAYVEYENGATGVFVTSTSDFPGTNRLEVTGDNGKIVIEEDKLTFWRNRYSERRYNEDLTGSLGMPESWKCEVRIVGHNTQHVGILNNWTSAILNGTKLLAPGEEGIKGLTISNAMHLSAWTDAWVELPINEELFLSKLKERIETSKFPKRVL